jgi:hypothetical protein
MLYLLLCHRNNGYTNAPQCYVIRPLLFLCLFICVWFIQQRRNHVTSNGLIRLNWKVCGKDWSSLTLGDIPALAGRNEENQKNLPHDSRSKGHNLNRGPPEHEAAVLGTRTRRSVSVNRRKYSRVQLKRDGTRRRTGEEVKGKLANGVGSQYYSHYLGTWCIQHYYHCYR